MEHALPATPAFPRGGGSTLCPTPAIPVALASGFVLEGARFEATPRQTARPYGLTPVLATHYVRSAAVVQKICALAGRTDPQARDVFDLGLLFAEDVGDLDLGDEQRGLLDVAIDRAIGLSFDEFTSNVVAYLDPEQAAPHEDRAAWDELLARVVARLEALR